MRALDSGVFGLVKLPVPLLKASLNHVRNKKLRSQIIEALNYHKQVN
jgi:hypothetical protein